MEKRKHSHGTEPIEVHSLTDFFFFFFFFSFCDPRSGGSKVKGFREHDGASCLVLMPVSFVTDAAKITGFSAWGSGGSTQVVQMDPLERL